MSWELEYASRVKKQLKNIDNKYTIRRIRDSVRRLEDNPKSAPLLSGTSKPTRSLRFGTPDGEYRAVYLLVEEDKTVYIFHLEKRESDYEDLHRKYDL